MRELVSWSPSASTPPEWNMEVLLREDPKGVIERFRIYEKSMQGYPHQYFVFADTLHILDESEKSDVILVDRGRFVARPLTLVGR